MTRLREVFQREPKSGFKVPRWLERLLSVGIVSTVPDVVRRQRCVNVGIYATVVNALNHLVTNSLHDFTRLLPINIYNVMMIVVPLLFLRLHRRGENLGAVALGLLIVFGHQLVVWAFGLESDLQVYYTLMPGGLLLLLGVQNWRWFLLFLVLSLGALLFALYFAPSEGLLIPDDEAFRNLLSTQAMVNAIAINASILFYALTTLKQAEIELENQHERSEALIETVMPRPIAERLKAGEQRIADRIEMLSVLFADLVGFTSAAHDLAPEAVVEYLDGLVRVCDELSARYGVEKIKTIGDSYMAAAGFDGRSAEGAIAIGRFALALKAEMGSRPPLNGRKLGMRIGIHCGPATAGVIGDTRFSYDVWGDAVNTASRMESYGTPDCIHVSEDYRRLVGDAFTFEERGATEMKGIGETRTFFLTGERAQGADVPVTPTTASTPVTSQTATAKL
jgi:adenylate cyclase